MHIMLKLKKALFSAITLTLRLCGQCWWARPSWPLRHSHLLDALAESPEGQPQDGGGPLCANLSFRDSWEIQRQ